MMRPERSPASPALAPATDRSADDIHRRQHGPIQLRNISIMQHPRQPLLRDSNGKRLDLADPKGDHAVVNSRQRKAANAVKQAAHSNAPHLAATVRAILTAL